RPRARTSGPVRRATTQESYGLRYRYEAADHQGVRDHRGRHRLARGPDRAPLAPDLLPDRAPQDPQARPPHPSWSDAAGRSAQAPPAVPAERRHRALPLADQASRHPPVTTAAARPRGGRRFRVPPVPRTEGAPSTAPTRFGPRQWPAEQGPGAPDPRTEGD